MRTLYLDLDDVLGDFVTHYKNVFGVNVDHGHAKDIDWDAVRHYDGFSQTMPRMSDAFVLWEYVFKYQPTILTGVPINVPQASENKKEWVRRNLGHHVPVICCLSREKYMHCKPGDVLVDDYERYKDLWIRAGGVWITHISAEKSIEELQKLGF